jgi:Post-segregation antitoxin CcdA
LPLDAPQCARRDVLDGMSNGGGARPIWGVNVSWVYEEGLESAVRRERARRWQKENAEGSRSWNAYVERHGVPPATGCLS